MKQTRAADARALYSAGRYEESLALYNEYLKKYPESRVAREERTEAQQALDASRSKTTVTAKATTKATTTAATPNQQPSRWQRFRRAWTSPRKLKFTREGKYYLGITLGVGFAAINTGNNLLYLLLGMLLSLMLVSGVMSDLSLRRLTVTRRLAWLTPREKSISPSVISASSTFIDFRYAFSGSRRTRIWNLPGKRLSMRNRPSASTPAFRESSAVTVYPARRYVVDALRTSTDSTTCGANMSVGFSRNTTAVITLVMLAIER